jgi:hypothetical protein
VLRRAGPLEALRPRDGPDRLARLRAAVATVVFAVACLT